MDIKVYCGAEGTVLEAIEQFDAGALEEATPASGCSGHDHGDGGDGGHHGHGDGHGHSISPEGSTR